MMVGFAIALLASLWSRHWACAALSLLALVEAKVGLRLPFHVWVRDDLLGYPAAPEAKTALQIRLLEGTAVAAVVVVLAVLPLFLRASAGRRLTLVGIALILGTLALELISLHRMDAVIYHPEGPFLRSAIAYFLGAASMTAGVLLQHRRSKAGTGVTA